MEIRISMPGAAMKVDVKNESARGVFRTLAGALLIYATRAEDEKEAAEAVHEEEKTAECAPDQKKEAAETGECSVEDNKTPEEGQETSEPAGIMYKGFLHVECRECGTISSFYKKEPKDHFHCKTCGRKHVFSEPLVPMWVSCECGKTFKYMTNREDPILDIGCLECSSLVTLKWNAKKRVYETIGR